MCSEHRLNGLGHTILQKYLPVPGAVYMVDSDLYDWLMLYMLEAQHYRVLWFHLHDLNSGVTELVLRNATLGHRDHAYVQCMINKDATKACNGSEGTSSFLTLV
jgi:hypothetical protein